MAYSDEPNSASTSKVSPGSVALAQQGFDRAVRRLEMRAHGFVHVFEDANDSDHRRGINSLTQRLVIKAHVAAGNGSFQDSSQAFLLMPSMVWENCHMMCGFSGLPKFRQSS